MSNRNIYKNSRYHRFVKSEWVGCPEWEYIQSINCKLFDRYGIESLKILRNDCSITFRKEDNHLTGCDYCIKTYIDRRRKLGLLLYPRLKIKKIALGTPLGYVPIQ